MGKPDLAMGIVVVVPSIFSMCWNIVEISVGVGWWNLSLLPKILFGVGISTISVILPLFWCAYQNAPNKNWQIKMAAMLSNCIVVGLVCVAIGDGPNTLSIVNVIVGISIGFRTLGSVYLSILAWI